MTDIPTSQNDWFPDFKLISISNRNVIWPVGQTSSFDKKNRTKKTVCKGNPLWLPCFSGQTQGSAPTSLFDGDIGNEYLRSMVYFMVNLVDYFSEQKPSLFIRTEKYDGEYSIASIQEAFNRFFDECVSKQEEWLKWWKYLHILPWGSWASGSWLLFPTHYFIIPAKTGNIQIRHWFLFWYLSGMKNQK